MTPAAGGGQSAPSVAPLAGLLVVDASQFLAGPYASLRLGDLGARVIKIERRDGGDLCRRLYLSDTVIDGESTLFHAINRDKESLALDLTEPRDQAALRKLMHQADVFIQNFRPGVIERLGFSAEVVRALNPRIVYGSVSGYGAVKGWAELPGQDLLAQAKSGIMWLNGKAGDGPVPVGLPVADILAGANLVQGILAALVRRGISGEGALVETSLLESLLDLQFEFLTTWLNRGDTEEAMPARGERYSAHAGLGAPYGVFPTADGYLALAMMPFAPLARLLDLPALAAYDEKPAQAFQEREVINRQIAERLLEHPAVYWQDRLEREDVWCSSVYDWASLLDAGVREQLDMISDLISASGDRIALMRSPVRINGERALARRVAPGIDQDGKRVRVEFGLGAAWPGR